MATVDLSRKAVLGFEVNRGNTFAPLPVAFSIDGVAEDFSGAVITMQVFNNGGTEVKSLTNSSGITVSSNTLQFSISATDTATWSDDLYNYEVKKTISGVVSTILAGTIRVK